MKHNDLEPYHNESDSITIGDELTVENHLDQVSIFGSVDFTKDKQGLAKAIELKTIIDKIVTTLQASDLPEVLEQGKNVIKAKSPFAE